MHLKNLGSTQHVLGVIIIFTPLMSLYPGTYEQEAVPS